MLELAAGSLPERKFRYQALRIWVVSLLALTIVFKLYSLWLVSSAFGGRALATIAALSLLLPCGCLWFVYQYRKEGFLLTAGLGLYYLTGALRHHSAGAGFLAAVDLALPLGLVTLSILVHRRVFGPLFPWHGGRSRAV